MTTYEERDIDVWIVLGETTEPCDLGYEHPVTYYARKRLGPVIETRAHDNGYEVRETGVRRDRQGRTYHQHVRIDYTNNTSWRRDEDGKMFWPRPPYAGKDAIRKDVMDRVIQ